MDRDRKLAEMTREIPLNNGMVAIVDAIDYDAVSYFSWHAEKKNDSYYVVSRDYAGAKPQTIYLHQLICPIERPLITDHKNGNPLDNRRSNLRACTRSQSNMNRKAHKRRANIHSRYKGVSWHRNKWQATIMIDGKNACLGSFESEIDAAIAYNKKAKELHGEFARLNEVHDG